MAASTSFKQECPSCEAMVPIKDTSLIGRKIDCPKCKFQFKVEAPPDSAEKEEAAETVTNGKASADKITTGKPADTKTNPAKSVDTKVASQKLADGKATNGKTGASKTTKDKAIEDKVTTKPAAKAAPVAKNGKPGAKKSKTDENGASPKKKKGDKKVEKKGGMSRVLILGGVLGVVAVIGLMVGGFFLFFGKKSNKNTTDNKTTSNTPAKGASTSGGDATKKDGGDKKDPSKENVAELSNETDVSNLLPNDTAMVVSLNIPAILKSSLRSAAFTTPGAFQDSSFPGEFGFPLEDVQRVIHAYVPAQRAAGESPRWSGVFSVMRTKKAIARDKLLAGLKLDPQATMSGKPVDLVKAHLDSLSTYLVKGNVPQDGCYLHMLDEYTLVFANKPVMETFLANKDKPEYYLTPKPKPAPPPETKKPDKGPSKGPTTTTPPPPATKPTNRPMSAGPHSSSGLATLENKTVGDETPLEDAGMEPGAGLVRYQKPEPRAKDKDSDPKPKTTTPGPMDPKPTDPDIKGTKTMTTGPSGSNPAPGPSGSNPTPGPSGPPPVPAGAASWLTVKPALKNVLDKVERPNHSALFVVASSGDSPLAMAIGQRLLDLIPSNGFGPHSDKVIRTRTETLRAVNWAALSLSTLYERQLLANVVIDGQVEQKAEIEKAVRFVGALAPFFVKSALELDIHGLSEQGESEPKNPNNRPGPETGPRIGPMTGGQTDGKTQPDANKNKDGSLTLRVENALVLTLDLNLENKPAYSFILEKLGEFCVQLKSQTELIDPRSHVHQLAAALEAYVQDRKAFPRGTVDRPAGGRKVSYPPDERLSWMTELLTAKSSKQAPFLGHGSYSKLLFDPNQSWRDKPNVLLGMMIVPEYLARTKFDQVAQIRYGLTSAPIAVTHFVGMSGVGYDAAEYRADDAAAAKKIGIFGYDRITKLADVPNPDKTIALIQVRPELAGPWVAGGGSTVRGVSDDPKDVAIEPFVCMEHNGAPGTVVVMADGKVRFIPKSIANNDFIALCAINADKPSANIDAIAPLYTGETNVLKSGPAPADAKPADGKPVDGKPTESKPMESKPMESKPADGKPTDARPMSK
jgi:hypothetical protein